MNCKRRRGDRALSLVLSTALLIAAAGWAAIAAGRNRGRTMISDPIEFELFKNALFGVADEMALTVFRTTYSGVLKDNMDYSTAMFDGAGVLVAQGLTLPGHLGSMPTAMAALQQAFAGRIHPGDVFIFNDPFQGGMHLPDVFVFKPIFTPAPSAQREALPLDGGGLGGGDRADPTGFAASSPPPRPSAIER